MLRPWFLALSLAIPAAAQNAPAPQSTPQPAPRSDAQKGAVSNLGTDVDAVRQRIESALAGDPTLRGSSFSVNVTDDTVEITGVANNGRERTAARRIVQSFSGNLRVKDRITVAGVTPSSAEPPAGDQPRARTATTPNAATTPDPNAPDPNAPNPSAPTPEQQLAKPESDEDNPAKKANKPKRDPKKHGDKATEDPRDPRKSQTLD